MDEFELGRQGLARLGLAQLKQEISQVQTILGPELVVDLIDAGDLVQFLRDDPVLIPVGPILRTQLLADLIAALLIVGGLVIDLFASIVANDEARQLLPVVVGLDKIREPDPATAQDPDDPLDVAEALDERFELCPCKGLPDRSIGLVSLAAAHAQFAVLQAARTHSPSHLALGEHVLRLSPALDAHFVQGRLGDVHHAMVEELRHLSKQEGQ